MKAYEDVQMIAAKASVVFARACEMVILELTHRAWTHVEKNKCQTLQKKMISPLQSAEQTFFYFLVDIVPTTEGRGEG
ncbi:hypothetical protein IEQ34_010037 [Dendrobium chrysotoxum]|uniref:Core Histone H2A/H2B/H3 domain-containing protein n=1 Tax=Dendrobium chrysotoxum TaxID=161865 RepID=A0AAV7H0P4_DENCH|nr:hypothetical protein IEQ34_010037 [Dendrobium chrysotoxum]